MDTIRRLTVQSVLTFLAQAGPGGAITTEIALAHDYPASYHQRSNRVSQVTLQLAREGCAEPMGTERSPLYRGTPVSRWCLTPAGMARQEAGATREQAAARSTALQGEIARSLAARTGALAAVQAEIAELVRDGGLAAVTKQYRAAAVRRLRAVPCTLTEIGQLFGLTRERVRQIETGPAAGQENSEA